MNTRIIFFRKDCYLKFISSNIKSTFFKTFNPNIDYNYSTPHILYKKTVTKIQKSLVGSLSYPIGLPGDDRPYFSIKKSSMLYELNTPRT